MKNLFKILTLTTVFTFSLFIQVNAKEVLLDRVAVIVNSGVVLESEIQDLLSMIKRQAKQKNQSLPADETLRIQATEKLINNSLVLQLGERMGVQVSDAQLDETINNIAKSNNLALDEFRRNIIAEGTNYEKYRENVRTELITGEVSRASVRRRIYISPQEIANLLATLKAQSNNSVEYNLGHILIEFPSDATQEAINLSKQRADKVIELLNNGSDFTKIAMSASGGANALEGGDLGWMNINEMPTLFSELIDGKAKGDIFGPIRTGLGFSVVKILDLRGQETIEVEEVNARHILIKPSIIISEAKAESILQGFLDKINAGEADFAELAKEHSQGPTSVRGGDLGWADPRSYDAAFKDALATLKVNEYHKPFRSSFGWHLVQLTDRRILDATTQANENKAYQILHNRKFGLEQANWMKEIRGEAYIEVFDVGQN